MIPQPDGLDFERWSAYVVEEFAIDGISQSAPWQEFGNLLLAYPKLVNLPRTEGFRDWQEWARRCMFLFL